MGLDLPSVNNALDSIGITLDVDWAAEEVLEEVITALTSHGVSCTFFATHDSEVLRNAASDGIEIGLHPDFRRCGNDYYSELKRLKDLYPTAVGARSHGLYCSSEILATYQQVGLVYESNIFLRAHQGLHPVLRDKDLLSVPFIWSDDKELQLGLRTSLDQFGLDRPGLKVFNFHPIHIFTNAVNEDSYLSIKPYYHDVKELRQRRCQQGGGVGELFNSLLQYLYANKLASVTMKEICQQQRSWI